MLTVSGRLGHSNAATTLGVYSHFLESVDRAAADLLGGLINRPSAAATERNPANKVAAGPVLRPRRGLADLEGPTFLSIEVI